MKKTKAKKNDNLTPKKKNAKKTKKVMPRYKYKEKYCEDLKEFMARGLSFQAFAGEIGVTRECLYEWERQIPEFAQAKKEAFAKCEIFWEEKGIQGMIGQIDKFNASSWIFNMKNRFKWTDRMEQKVDASVTLESLVGESFKDE